MQSALGAPAPPTRNPHLGFSPFSCFSAQHGNFQQSVVPLAHRLLQRRFLQANFAEFSDTDFCNTDFSAFVFRMMEEPHPQ
jgi:hypothetical protein